MRSLTTDQFKLMRRGSDRAIRIINTLSPDNFEETCIPGSVNIPLTDERFFEKVEQEIGGRAMPVVVYCASEQCDSSRKAAQRLEEVGFSNVYDYQGGAEAWKRSGGEVGAAGS